MLLVTDALAQLNIYIRLPPLHLHPPIYATSLILLQPTHPSPPQGCTVEWEGLVGQHWVFSITEPSGTSLLRLRSDI